MARNNKVKAQNSGEPLVSIIVPTYNREGLIGRTLTSLLNQSYQNIEIVVVNDGGRDILPIINSYTSSKIKYIVKPENSGLAATRNVGLKNSTGKYICLLDDDDIYLKYAIEFRMYMMKKLKAEIVYTRALLDHWEKREEGYVSVGKVLYWDCPFDRDLILIQNIAPCCCPLFSRKVWEQSNYMFDEELDTSEDFDFWIALSRWYDFKELKFIDCECTKRSDGTQMTGARNFGKAYPVIYNRWRHTADDIKNVTISQNNMLIKMGFKPEEFGL